MSSVFFILSLFYIDFDLIHLLKAPKGGAWEIMGSSVKPTSEDKENEKFK